MAREAYPYIIVLLVIALFSGALGFYPLTLLVTPLLLFVIYFFRDPLRIVPAESGIVVAPADGRITKIALVDPTAADSAQLISIFLSPFDVHINRSPVAGRIVQINHVKGRFVPATREDASLINEQNVITIESESLKVVMKQIAGIIARRCVLWKHSGETVALGEKVGLIKFSSRTDLILPPEFKLLVKAGDRVIGGVTIMGRKN